MPATTPHDRRSTDAPEQPRAVFRKPMSDPVPIPAAGVARALELLRSNRPFRYGEDTQHVSETARLEAELAAYTGRRYAVAVNSCGCSLFLALKALGVAPGEPVLCNAFTLAPVPGAVAHAAARPVLVGITERLTVDLDDLQAKIRTSGARVFLMSQMRGHLSDLAAVARLCAEHDVALIEDCAHTLGARFDGRMAGTFGRVGCYSAQTFKHINAGEGGVVVTDDADIAAQVILMSGSYMLYRQHGARPDDAVFERWRDVTPNFSMRMTDTAAALLRPQLPQLSAWTERWNAAYRHLEAGLATLPGLTPIRRDPREAFVGSSIQFTVDNLPAAGIARFIEEAAAHGVYLKWFGAERAIGFTSRYDQWGYVAAETLSATDAVLRRLLDMRVAVSLDAEDCATILRVLGEAMAAARRAPSNRVAA